MSYYAVVSPGLEKLACQELLEKFPGTNVRISHGGLEIDLDLQSGFVLNHTLKIPTRILFRLMQAKVRDLPKLYKKVKALDWRPFYIQAPILEVIHVSAHSYRLFEERKIKKATKDAIEDFFKGTQAKKVDTERLKDIVKDHCPALYLRFKDDELTLSIDTSGDRLDRRGKRSWIGMAPLRETYAHACLLALKEKIEIDAPLCDPMSGSGVFAREALDWNKNNNDRYFSYQSFPITKEVQFPAESETPWKNIIAVESEAKTFEALKHNLKDEVRCIQANALENLEISPGSILIANPPYGIRLKLDNPVAFLNHVVEKLMSYQPKALALLIPKDIKINRRYELLLEFSNGGIPVKLIYFKG